MGKTERMRILLVLVMLLVPCAGHCAVVLASTEYVQSIVNSIQKTNSITDTSTDEQLPTAAAVWNLGAKISDDVNAHVNNTDNPHNVTAQQVGLENVKNVDTTDAANITSGKMAYDRLPVGMVANTVAAGDDDRFFGVPRAKPNKDAPDGMVWMWFE